MIRMTARASTSLSPARAGRAERTGVAGSTRDSRTDRGQVPGAAPSRDSIRHPARGPFVLALVAAGLLLAGCVAGPTGSSAKADPAVSAAPARPPSSQAEVDTHVARATTLAGKDLGFLLSVCKPQPAERPHGPEINDYVEKMIARPPPPPGQVFDNLYFVGAAWVSAWVLKTSEGLILIDALNTDAEAQALIEGGMRQLGLDPKDIRYLIVTHGHGDHYGGAKRFVDQYGVRVVASDLDWTMMETGLEFDLPVWPAPPRRDLAVKDGDTLTLGDTTLRWYVTPGHTLGTLSPVFEVRQGDRRWQALLWGGTSFNFGRDLDRLDGYIDSAERMRRLTASLPIDVLLSNHPGSDDTVRKMADQGRGAPGHPFVGGRQSVDRSLQVLAECARAQRARFLIP